MSKPGFDSDEYIEANSLMSECSEIKRSIRDFAQRTSGPVGSRGDFVSRLMRGVGLLLSELDYSDFKAIAAEKAASKEPPPCSPNSSPTPSRVP